jgi:hypothetical protein
MDNSELIKLVQSKYKEDELDYLLRKNKENIVKKIEGFTIKKDAIDFIWHNMKELAARETQLMIADSILKLVPAIAISSLPLFIFTQNFTKTQWTFMGAIYLILAIATVSFYFVRKWIAYRILEIGWSNDYAKVIYEKLPEKLMKSYPIK